jgi:hypothetical protein
MEASRNGRINARTQFASISEIGAGTTKYIKIRPEDAEPKDWLTAKLVYDGADCTRLLHPASV